MIFAAVPAIGLLMSGWGGLEARLPGGLPVGSSLSASALVLALPWLAVSVVLAGNLDLNFDNSAGPAWLAFSALVLVACFGALLAVFASACLGGRGSSKA